VNPVIYPFGYGLSYTTYEYKEIEALFEDNCLKASVIVTNTGDRDGEEIIQFYVQDVAAGRVRPVKELKGFEKIRISSGESRKVDFILPIQKLGYYDARMNYVIEPGVFRIYIGSDSENNLMKEIIM
jgi:beta-glucosidase